MGTDRLILGGMLLMMTFLAQGPPLQPDEPITCDACDAWNAPREPFRVFGNTYYVGVAGLSAVLIASDNGLVLLDGALPQSASSIDANIRALGFRTEDIRLIGNSHAHYDHAGGIAALQRVSGAPVVTSQAGVQALLRGWPVPDDPQYGFGAEMAFAPVRNLRAAEDGEQLRVGDVTVTMHFTPGHTPGGTTWTWRSCEGERCRALVYADSLTAVSAPGFKFTAAPGLVERFRRSIAKVEALPCDILISVHPEFTGLDRKRELRAQGVTPDPFIDGTACRTYAAAAARGLDRRIADEQ